MTNRLRTTAAIVTMLMAVTGIDCATCPQATPTATESKPLVAFLVRHAEKVDSSSDAALSEAGRARAAALAATLRSAGITHVHSSDFTRTRETAAPTAAIYALEVELYDPKDLPTLVGKLRKAGGRHLVVGHSDTTPALAALLGGEPGAPIEEASEYDRLYVITVGRDGAASSVLLRYGTPYHPNQEQ